MPIKMPYVSCREKVAYQERLIHVLADIEHASRSPKSNFGRTNNLNSPRTFQSTCGLEATVRVV